MSLKFIFATQNDNKVKEVLKILEDATDLTIQSLKAIGYHEDIEETGSTLDENAWIKADHLHNLMDVNIIAEDTGLEVFALDMAPGVFSARYAGLQKSSEDNMSKLLAEMSTKTDRSARFRTVVAVWLDGEKYSFEGVVNGRIATARSGNGGFGYDPIFIPEGYDESFGTLSEDIKNKISHRARAFEAFKEFLSKRS